MSAQVLHVLCRNLLEISVVKIGYRKYIIQKKNQTRKHSQESAKTACDHNDWIQNLYDARKKLVNIFDHVITI